MRTSLFLLLSICIAATCAAQNSFTASVKYTEMGIEDKITHVSTGGGACIDFLSGKPMPAIDALKAAKKRMTDRIKTTH